MQFADSCSRLLGGSTVSDFYVDAQGYVWTVESRSVRRDDGGAVLRMPAGSGTIQDIGTSGCMTYVFTNDGSVAVFGSGGGGRKRSIRLTAATRLRASKSRRSWSTAPTAYSIRYAWGAPRSFFRSIRAAASGAAELLDKGGHTVAEISELTGFSSPGYFSKCFQQHYGCRPSEFAGRNK